MGMQRSHCRSLRYDFVHLTGQLGLATGDIFRKLLPLRLASLALVLVMQS